MLKGLKTTRAEFNQTCYITSPHGKGVHEQHVFPCVRRPSICPSRNLLLNHVATTSLSPHVLTLFSLRPFSINLSFTLFPSKPQGGISANLLHYLPLAT